jgi:hypothetical protein
MFVQIRQAPWTTRSLEIGGRGEKQQLLASQPARDERGVPQRTGADRDVDAVLDEIDIEIGKARIDAYGRMLTYETREQRQHHHAPETHRHVDAQRARGRRAAD